MPFSVTWHTLVEHCADLPPDATLVTPLSHRRFRIADVQEHRIVADFQDDTGKRPLQREQFETLYEHLQDTPEGFDLQRLPPDADPYPAVLSLHPRFEIDEDAGTIVEREGPTASQLVDASAQPNTDEASDRTEPDLDVYADALLLVDALERHDATVLEDVETPALVNLYTLLSEVQRDADDLRKDVADVLLGRLHHDQPVSGEFGSVQRTSRRSRSLRDEEEVLSAIEDAGIDPERVMGVDRSKVEDALDVTDLSEADVFEVSEREFVRKADVDESGKESRLQGLKDRLALADDPEAAQLRAEIEDLERRIEDLTEFSPGHSVADGFGQ